MPVTHTLAGVRATYDPQELEPDTHTGDVVSVAGRVIHVRNTGKLCFARLREGDGTELQAMLSIADVGEEALADWKALVDIGDFVGVTGEVITSRRGELSVQATAWTMAAKTLRPLPNEHRPLSDEARVRLRYVDMVVNPSSREMVRTKATVLRSLRRTLDERGFLEVETPILQLTNGGAAARPFRTHLNAFDQPMLLRIALELDLKKAMIGGVDRVYEIGRTFRNEGLDSTHAAEFSMLEAYEAYGDIDVDEGARPRPRGRRRPRRGAHRGDRAQRRGRSTWSSRGARPGCSSWSRRRPVSRRRRHPARRPARAGREARHRAAAVVGRRARSLSSSTSSWSRTR